jgi:hypothetical protein
VANGRVYGRDILKNFVFHTAEYIDRFRDCQILQKGGCVIIIALYSSILKNTGIFKMASLWSLV